MLQLASLLRFNTDWQATGDHTGIFAELMLEFGKTGRFNYCHAPDSVITALVSLDDYNKATFKFNGMTQEVLP